MSMTGGRSNPRKRPAKAGPAATVDFFKNARAALTARRRQLKEQLRLDPAVAMDVLGMVRLGLLASDSVDAIIARDVRLLDLWHLLGENEEGAALELHGFLADELLTDHITPTMRVLLSAMHNALSRGIPAEEAMHLKPPYGAGRKKKTRRDDDIRAFVRSRLFHFPGRKKPDPVAIKEAAARIFGVSKKTVDNICAGASP